MKKYFLIIISRVRPGGEPGELSRSSHLSAVLSSVAAGQPLTLSTQVITGHSAIDHCPIINQYHQSINIIDRTQD